MFDMTVIHTQYLIIAFLGGIELTILLILGYIAMWIPRVEKDGHYQGYKGGWKTAFLYHPWIVLLIYIGVGVYAAWFLVHYAANPPNW